MKRINTFVASLTLADRQMFLGNVLSVHNYKTVKDLIEFVERDILTTLLRLPASDNKLKRQRLVAIVRERVRAGLNRYHTRLPIEVFRRYIVDEGADLLSWSQERFRTDLFDVFGDKIDDDESDEEESDEDESGEDGEDESDEDESDEDSDASEDEDVAISSFYTTV
jgi:hypothetical protein